MVAAENSYKREVYVNVKKQQSLKKEKDIKMMKFLTLTDGKRSVNLSKEEIIQCVKDV